MDISLRVDPRGLISREQLPVISRLEDLLLSSHHIKDINLEEQILNSNLNQEWKMVFECQRDSYKTEFTTKVVSSKECGPNEYEIVLEDTILFPEGGGQVSQ